MRKVPVFDLCVGTYGQGIQIMERGRIPDMKYIVNTCVNLCSSGYVTG